MASTNSPLRAFPFRLVVALAVTTSLMVVGIVGVNLAIDSKLSVIKRVDVAVASAPPEGANYLQRKKRRLARALMLVDNVQTR